MSSELERLFESRLAEAGGLFLGSIGSDVLQLEMPLLGQYACPPRPPSSPHRCCVCEQEVRGARQDRSGPAAWRSLRAQDERAHPAPLQ